MAVVGAVAAVFSAYAGYEGNRKAQAAADRAAKKEQTMAAHDAAAIEAETAEQQRRARNQADKTEAENRARAAASGVDIDTGTIDIALDSMSEEHARQISWMGKVGASAVQSALMGGSARAAAQRATGSQFAAQKWGSIAQGASNVYSIGQKSNWWT